MEEEAIMSTNPSLAVVKRHSINWRNVFELVVLVLLALVIAIALVGLLLAISSNSIEVG